MSDAKIEKRDYMGKYTCPVCGYNELEVMPYKNKRPSEEICPCCGFQFGCDDNYEIDNLEKYHKKWRDGWIERGCIWFSRKTKCPTNWSPQLQLDRLFETNK